MTDVVNAHETEMKPKIGMAVASLILGCLSIGYGLFIIGVLFAVPGLILGVLHLRMRADFRAMAVWGVALSVIGLLLSGWVGYSFYRAFNAASGGGSSFGPWLEKEAPDFSVTTLDGQTIQLSELRGKPVIVDFWATWCPPCVREIPHFIQLAGEFSTDQLAIVGISSEEASVLMEFAAEKGINYPIASADDLPAPYSEVRSIPTTFFIDAGGVIQAVVEGYHDYETLKAAAFAGESLETESGR